MFAMRPIITGFAGGLYQWENQTILFNFNRGGWDIIYSITTPLRA